MPIDDDYIRNYLAANKVGSEDDLVMVNMMSGGKPILTSTTEPREYRAPGEYCSESAFATNSLAAKMMGAWDAEVGRPIPEKASESYRASYAAKLERMASPTPENASLTDTERSRLHPPPSPAFQAGV